MKSSDSAEFLWECEKDLELNKFKGINSVKLNKVNRELLRLKELNEKKLEFIQRKETEKLRHSGKKSRSATPTKNFIDLNKNKQ